MRKLKFRAWDLDEKKYHYEICLKPLSDVIAIEIYDGEMLPIRTRCLVEQYTGLKDKNGKEIYEGDIVEYMTCYYGNEKRHRKVVEWEEWDSDDFGEPHNLGYFNLSECMEVIGNIHENPELLREEEE